MIVWALIGCTKSKQPFACEASYMYLPSLLFQGAWREAESEGQRPLILSAKHGLLTPNQRIEPYDMTLNKMPKVERDAWALNVLASLRRWLQPGDTVVSYLGARYAETVVPTLRNWGYTVEEPLKGKSQGKRLQWFKERREQRAQLGS